MKSLRILLLVSASLSISFSIGAQPRDEKEPRPCSQDAVERHNLIVEAEAAEYNVRRIEIVGNTYSRYRVFSRKMAFNEGDIFTSQKLSETIKGFNTINTIEPITIDSVEVRLDRQHRDIDFVFCVTQKEKN